MSDLGSEHSSDDGAAPPAAADLREWDEWDDDPGEDDATRSLFSDAVLPSPEACFAHDAERHGFDIRQFRAQLSLDDYGTIRVINFIRREVAAGSDPLPALRAAAAAAVAGSRGAPWPWTSDEYLPPVIGDDPLLGYDYDDDAAEEGWAAAAAAGTEALTPAPGADAAGPSTSASAGAPAAPSSAHDAMAALRAENAALRSRLQAVVAAALPEELRGGGDAGAAGPTDITVSERDGEPGPSDGGPGGNHGGGAAPAASEQGGSGAAAGVVLPPRRGARGLGAPGVAVPSAAAASIDAAYFESYSYFDIHREMLGDKARTEAYRDALEGNPGLLGGARVLDVGCGTGILSMFAARGGAKAVVGLDGSDRIAGFARQIVAANGLDAEGGGPVSVVAGRVEEVAGIGLEQVDVIVSEWMGYALLFESMLDSVLAARDRWLRPGGAVLPDIATIYAAGAGDAALGLDFWQDVYGFTMAPVSAEIWRGAAGKVALQPVPASALATRPAALHRMDLATMAPRDQDFTAEVVMAAQEPASAEGGGAAVAPAAVSCVVLWFDVEFSARFCAQRPVVLSTSPAAEQTHWVQAVLPLKAPLELPAGGALAARVSMARSPARHRALDVSLEYGVLAAGAGSGAGEGLGAALREAVSFCMEIGGKD